MFSFFPPVFFSSFTIQNTTFRIRRKQLIHRSFKNNGQIEEKIIRFWLDIHLIIVIVSNNKYSLSCCSLNELILFDFVWFVQSAKLSMECVEIAFDWNKWNGQINWLFSVYVFFCLLVCWDFQLANGVAIWVNYKEICNCSQLNTIEVIRLVVNWVFW